MINLIPTEAKKYVRMEYWTRVVSVWLLLLMFAAVILGSLLIPSSALISSQLQVFENGYASIDTQNIKYKTLKQQIRIANDTAQQLLSTQTIRPFSDIITLIENQTNTTIKIKSITSSRTEEEKIETVQVVGTADSRQALVSFRDSLESQEMFESVDLPLSNLAKDKDVPFNISIRMAVIQQ